VDWAETLAYGPLNLRPWEFNRLQPHEFYKILDGYKWRMDERNAIISYFVTPLINSQGTMKKAVTMKDLLSPLQNKKEEKQQEKEYLRQIFNLQDGG